MENQGFPQRGTGLSLSLSSCTKGRKLILLYVQANNTRQSQRVPAQQANFTRDTKCPDLDLTSHDERGSGRDLNLIALTRKTQTKDVWKTLEGC